MREFLKGAALLAVTVLADRWLARLVAVPGVALADPVTVIAVSAAVTAAATVGTGVANYLQSQDAANAAKSLRDQQAAQLNAQQQQETALANQEAVTGQNFAKSNDMNVLATGLGFGAGNGGPNTGFGRASLTAGGGAGGNPV